MGIKYTVPGTPMGIKYTVPGILKVLALAQYPASHLQ
jgi:hypothetical protein